MTDRTAPGLLPCPFCGSEPVLNEWDDWDGRAQVCCENEECVIQPHTPCEKGDDRPQAIADWNRRAAGQAHQQGQRDAELIAECGKAIDSLWNYPDAYAHSVAELISNLRDRIAAQGQVSASAAARASGANEP